MVTFDLAPEEILHVGDSLIYDGKAVDIGMKFCHIINPEDLLAKLKKRNLLMRNQIQHFANTFTNLKEAKFNIADYSS